MVVKFTHDRVIDYHLPGIAPTGLPVEIAAVVVAQFKDGKLRARTSWDQASVLVQLGKLDPKGLPVGALINRCRAIGLWWKSGQAVKARPSDAQDLRRSAAGASEFNAVENGNSKNVRCHLLQP